MKILKLIAVLLYLTISYSQVTVEVPLGTLRNGQSNGTYFKVRCNT